MHKIMEFLPASREFKKFDLGEMGDGWDDEQLQSTDQLKLHFSYEPEKLNTDWRAMLKQSLNKRNDARAHEAVVDALRAKNMYKQIHPKSMDPEIEFEMSDAMLETNEFEKTKLHIHDTMDQITGSQIASMQRRSLVVDKILYDTLSNETIHEVHRLINTMMIELGKRPKYVKPECDVLSILEKEENFISPLERKRRERVFKTVTQAYLQSSWKDITFLKQLRENRNLLLEQYGSNNSSDFLKTLINDKYQTLRNFTNMLHARQPMYSLNTKRFPNKEFYNLHQQANLFRIQYQTRRNMFKALQTIRMLIKKHDLAKLTIFVEDIMDNYVAYKTQRIMPWNFEFINEVYNFLGLALIKEYKISSKLKMLHGQAKIATLLNIPSKLANTSKNASDTSIPIKREKTDYKANLYKQRMNRFEARMRFAKHTIERSYLCYSAAQANLENNNFAACCLWARKSINEAKKGNHYLWAALSALVACKAHTALGKLENQKMMLTSALKFAKFLKNIELILFVEICLKINKEEMELKKSLAASEMVIKRRNHRSWSSQDISVSGSSSVNSRRLSELPETSQVDV